MKLSLDTVMEHLTKEELKFFCRRRLEFCGISYPVMCRCWDKAQNIEELSDLLDLHSRLMGPLHTAKILIKGQRRALGLAE